MLNFPARHSPIWICFAGYAYVDYEDEGTATLLADAKCDLKKDPFRGPRGILGGDGGIMGVLVMRQQ